jgi:hypothetical protein
MSVSKLDKRKSWGELTHQEQEIWVDHLIDTQIPDDWHDEVRQDLASKLEEKGWEGVDLQFSGFWSQGDGASFEAHSIDLQRIVEHYKISVDEDRYFGPDTREGLLHPDVAAELLQLEELGLNMGLTRLSSLALDRVDASIRRTPTRYNHEMTCSIDWRFDVEEMEPQEEGILELAERIVMKIMDRVEKHRIEECKSAYQEIEDCWEHHVEEINGDASSEWNEWRAEHFTADPF